MPVRPFSYLNSHSITDGFKHLINRSLHQDVVNIPIYSGSDRSNITPLFDEVRTELVTPMSSFHSCPRHQMRRRNSVLNRTTIFFFGNLGDEARKRIDG